MAQITSAEITKLRTLTGAGLMDCKNALIEANGDIDKAIEIIRKKGQAVAMKRADRVTNEGRVVALVTPDNKFGILLALGCETDFVAKNESFITLADIIAKTVLENKPESIEQLKELKVNNLTIADLINDKVAAIGEKIDVVYYRFLNAEYVAYYTHFGNKIGAIVGFNKAPINDQIGKNIAMQITAMNPVSIDKDDVPQDIINKELEIAKEQARKEGKPDNMIDKIAEGKLNKFYTEATLLNQQFIMDNKITVRQYLESNDKDLKVIKFYRCSVVL
ncbi:MAG: translation elongation factor Ts [Bacteroidales bacterium]|nr:translation elongation factor Ts [Bacteroidales bacterium]